MNDGRGAGPWPWIVVGLLAAMIAGSVAFLRIAVANPDALVVSDARTAPRSYHEDVRAERRGEALGWRVDLEAHTRPGAADVRVRLRDADGSPLAAERVTLRRVRPAEGGLDETIDLRPGPDEGRDATVWSGHVALPRAGRWHLHVRVETAGEAVERTFAVHAAPPPA